MKTRYQTFPTADYRRQNDGSDARQRQSQDRSVLTSSPVPSSASEHGVYQAQDALVQSNRTVTTDAIALCKSLGGGRETGADPQAIAEAIPQNNSGRIDQRNLRKRESAL